MSQLIPPAFLFRVSIPVRRHTRLPRSGKGLLQLGAEYALPEITGFGTPSPYGTLRMAWNAGGLAVSLTVQEKSRPLSCDDGNILASDGLQVWIDTRCTQNIHRAGRFCHHFAVLPAGGGRDRQQPVIRQFPLARAKEDAPLANEEQILVQSDVGTDGYRLEVWLPDEVLHGFEPETNPRLGFYYLIRDAELGDQVLSVGPEFPYDHDPSLWWPLELV